MKILFCSDPLNRKRVDFSYEEEWEAAKRAGFETELIHLEEVLSGNPENAVKRLRQEEQMELAFYRGWMMTPEEYASFLAALLSKNILLANNTDQYEHCHYLPRSLSVIESLTPKTRWIDRSAISKASIAEALASLGEGSAIVKDFVKSRKHEWHEACFIPDASNFGAAMKVVSRFLELQGEDLNGGLVLRKFEELEFLGNHPKSGMPLTNEHRLFFLDGMPLASFRYWDEADYPGETPDAAQFSEIAEQVSSPFFTMDVAKKKDGEWIIVELGDGQVSGLPDNADLDAFYGALKRHFD